MQKPEWEHIVNGKRGLRIIYRVCLSIRREGRATRKRELPLLLHPRFGEPPSAYCLVFVIDINDNNNLTCINGVSPRLTVQDYLLIPEW